MTFFIPGLKLFEGLDIAGYASVEVEIATRAK
jgi:hypothetical protein